MFNKVLKPMLLKEIDKPFNSDDYIYELKYDGIRTLMYVSDKEFKIITRNGNDVASVFPELKNIKKIIGNHKVIFDGEIVAFKNDKPSFSELQKRSHLKNKSKIDKIIDEVPVIFVAFDIIFFDKDLTNLELLDRKEILNKFNDNDYFIKTKIYSDGLKLFSHVKKIGLEGIVAKQKTSKYLLDKRVDNWIKIKNFKKENFMYMVILSLRTNIAYFLGEYKNKTLNYIGKVSVMSDNPVLNQVKNLKKINNRFNNFDEEGNYVQPKYKILVHYMERTDNGTLRQPFIKKEKA